MKRPAKAKTPAASPAEDPAKEEKKPVEARPFLDAVVGMQEVAFRPLGEVEIHGNDKVLQRFYEGTLSIYLCI